MTQVAHVQMEGAAPPVGGTGIKRYSAVSNARWVALSQAARVCSQLASVALLSRLLPPEAYGLIAMAAVVTNFAYLFRDMGTAAAIIQRGSIDSAVVNTIHWTNVALGVAFGVTVAATSPMAAQAFRQPDLAPVLVGLALMFPLSGLGICRQAMLERESRFSAVALAEIVAAIGGLAVALVLAWRGAGVWSLVAQMLAASFLQTVLVGAASDYRPRLHWHRAELRSVLGFSGNLTLFNCVNYFSRNADSMVIGRLLGPSPLGVYAMAYRLMLFPVQNMTWVATRALFPVMSRSQDAGQEIGRLYLKATGFIAFLSAPLMAGMLVLREPIVDVLFGQKWHAVAGLLAWLAPAGFIQSIVSASGTIFMAKGRTALLLGLGTVGAIVQVSAFLIGSRWGIEGVAGWYLLANALNAIPVLYLTGKLVGVGWRQTAATLGRPMAIAAAMGIAVALLDRVVGREIGMAVPRLATLVFAGGAAYLAGSYAFNSSQLKDFLAFFRRRR